jgi:hypothetical protein
MPDTLLVVVKVKLWGMSVLTGPSCDQSTESVPTGRDVTRLSAKAAVVVTIARIRAHAIFIENFPLVLRHWRT